MQEFQQHWRQQNVDAHQDFTNFRQISTVNLCSQASYQKMVKAKSDQHHCPISVFPLPDLYPEAIMEIPRPFRELSQLG
jgi:hypothetical protein